MPSGSVKNQGRKVGLAVTSGAGDVGDLRDRVVYCGLGDGAAALRGVRTVA